MKKVIIIGSGILGATTAYKLAKKGANVTLVDRDDVGKATDAAAGIISPWLAQRRNKAWYHLAKNGARIYPELIAELTEDGESETGYTKVGAIGLHTSEERLMETRQRILKRREDAPEIGEVNLLSNLETKGLFPLAQDGYQSIHISGAARVDGSSLRKALLRAAKKHGATFVNGNAILTHTGNNITGVNVNNEYIEADTVVATSGAWMKELFKPLNIHLDVFPQKAQVVHLELPHLNTNNWPVVMPPNNQYILPFDNKRIVIGATHEKKAGFDMRVTTGGVHEILHKAIQIAPELAKGTLLEVKVGFRPFTPGSLPIIGQLPRYNNVLLANGLGASGLTTGPYIGTQLAKIVLGENIGINLNDYNVENALIQKEDSTNER